jgi:hypothetical protein
MDIIDDMIQRHSEMKVNQRGLLQLNIDIEEYRQLFTSMKIPSVMEEFDKFKAVINLYKVHQDDLQSYVAKEKRLEGIDRIKLQEYIDNRPTK